MACFYAWSEWREGGYIEPSTLNQYGYLDSIRDVFGPIGH